MNPLTESHNILGQQLISAFKKTSLLNNAKSTFLPPQQTKYIGAFVWGVKPISIINRCVKSKHK